MPSKDDLVKAINLIKTGETEPAGKILHDLLVAEPQNERAWLAMSYCVTTPEDKRFCLEKVLEIDPANSSAKKFIARLDQASPKSDPTPAGQNPSPTSTPPPQTWSMKNLYIAVGVSLFIIALIIILLALTSH
jgi:hypothetical protein